jgi:hypothetical protein
MVRHSSVEGKSKVTHVSPVPSTSKIGSWQIQRVSWKGVPGPKGMKANAPNRNAMVLSQVQCCRP